MNFTHLHVHSTYSVLDGMASIRDLIQRAKDMGQKALSITDHGSTSGLWEAQKIGDELGIKVILGSEFYYERESDGKNGHIVVLAKNNVGLSNIFKLQEYAYVDNFYRRPRINYNKLVQHKEGLVVLSACLASTFAQHLMNGEEDEAIAWASKFKAEFGDDFYLEIQPNAIPEQWEVNKSTVAIAKKLDIKYVATNDVHYVLKEDHFPHEVLLAMQTGKKMNDDKRFKFSTTDFWLRSYDEMVENFVLIPESDIIEGLNRTNEVADKCNARFVPGKYLPKYYDVPEGMTSRDLLVQEVTQGAIQKGKNTDRDYMLSVQDEINVIDEEGYSDYFLIVQDYVRSARERGETVGDGRGSAAGSKVVYLTDITRLEPSKYNLLFERFLAHGRSPDIDTDFSNQETVFEDLIKKYGENSVAKIVTFGTMTPKAVCRKVFSTFNHPTHIANSISRLIPDLCPSLSVAYQNAELLNMKEQYPLEFSVIERLEGMISHEGQHAGGIVIYPNLSSYLPVKTIGEDRSKRIVAFDMMMVEQLGFYKFDVLGLKTISVLSEVLSSIKEYTGEDVDLYNIDYEDEKVYDMLSRGHVSGIFQLSAQAQKVMEQKPRSFNDLIAINSLIRPGVGDWNEYIARRNGKEWSIHPDRMPYMADTFGTLTYQEQFLLDAKTFAGWDIAYADKHLRKNKDIKNDTELKSKFLSDSKERGYKEDEMLEVWKEIEASVDGGYSFNKSHSASYAMTSYQTAYLKCYYPEHFYAALMTSEETGEKGQVSIGGYIHECRQRGIDIIPPDIRVSTDKFVVVDDKISYRITAISHVGDSAIAHINELRPIKDFNDFMERKVKKYARRNVVTNLIKAGTFDFDREDRAELLYEFELSERTPKQIKDGFEPFKYEWNDNLKAKWEREVLGIYLSSHPLEKYGFHPLEHYDDGDWNALQGGEVVDIHVFKDKNGGEMAFVTLDTLYGNLKVVVFTSIWSDLEKRPSFTIGDIIMVKGRRSGQDILANTMEVLD